MNQQMIPKIMKFTVLPYTLVARAWMDPTFEESLVRHPRAFLLEKSSLFPRGAQYVILRDTASVKHFVVPWLDNTLAGESDDHLLEIITQESGSEPPFTEFLPPPLLLRAIRDPSFLSSLITSPTSTALEHNYDLKVDFRAIQNAPNLYHLPLRFNHAKTQDFMSIYTRLKGDDVVIASSKCCASGTCNDDIA